jgi:hypothetical protein
MEVYDSLTTYPEVHCLLVYLDQRVDLLNILQKCVTKADVRQVVAKTLNDYNAAHSFHIHLDSAMTAEAITLVSHNEWATQLPESEKR